jgi:LmbE family N-acetylglucosaminyl deacetylase
MQKYLRYIYKNLLPARFKNHLDLFPSLRSEAINFPRLLASPEKGEIVVLAPHQDDEVIGCGGTMHLHHLAGAHITNVYIMDGRDGGPEGMPEDLVAAARNKEAKDAAEIIGTDDLVFLGLRDTGAQSTARGIGELRMILQKLKPEIIYLPFLLDYHHHHIFTNKLFLGAVLEDGFTPPLVSAYEVWTPITPNCVVDVENVFSVKLKALDAFVTQTCRSNIIGASKGLAEYRAFIHIFRKGFVECFLRTSAIEYRRLSKLVKW